MEQKKKILVIEDDKDINHTLCLRLKMEGYEVLSAQEGYEGFYKARTQAPDLILLDLRLPGLPGEEICREVRKDARGASLPIIMLTAKDTDTDKIIGKVLGATYYMGKPFDMEALVRQISALI
jgi:DNA-binding response OmpR family regulator